MTPRRLLKIRLKRLDRIAGEVNALLVVLAVGLAVLDAVVFVMLDAPFMPTASIQRAEPGPPIDAALNGMSVHIVE